MNIGEILSLLGMIEKFASKIEKLWKEISEQIKMEKDEKKREKLMDALKRRDCSTVRDLLFKL